MTASAIIIVIVCGVVVLSFMLVMIAICIDTGDKGRPCECCRPCYCCRPRCSCCKPICCKQKEEKEGQ